MSDVNENFCLLITTLRFIFFIFIFQLFPDVSTVFLIYRYEIFIFKSNTLIFLMALDEGHSEIIDTPLPQRKGKIYSSA